MSFIPTKVCLSGQNFSRQKTSFVVTNTCLSQEPRICRHKNDTCTRFRHVHARWLTGCERESELSHDGNEVFVGGFVVVVVCLFVCLLVFFSQMMCCSVADYVSQLTAIILHPPPTHTHTHTLPGSSAPSPPSRV